MPITRDKPATRHVALTGAVLALLVGLPVAVWLDLHHISDASLQRQAADVDALLSNIRIYYGENVTSRVLAHPGGASVVQNYRDVPGGIPVPATLSIELAQAVSEQYSNISSRFVSDHPFTGRASHVLDEVEMHALEAFRARRETLLTESTWTALADRVRLISPVIMGAPCVECHNSHPLSTKRDWRVGDVRGIQVVSIGQPIAANVWSFKYLLGYLLFMAAAGSAFIALQRRQAAAVVAANRELASANDRMREDLIAAAHIQQAMLPAALPDTPHASFAWRFKPCATVGGDGLNVLRLDEDHIGLYVLDVVGHGPAAAMLAVAVARVLTPGPGALLPASGGEAGPSLLSPADVARRLDECFPFERGTAQFFTLLYAVLDLRARTLRFVSAGHPMPVLVRKNERPCMLAGAGAPPIGLGDGECEAHTVALAPGDRVYLYTDGITEAMSPARELFGMGRLTAALADDATLVALEIAA